MWTPGTLATMTERFSDILEFEILACHYHLFILICILRFYTILGVVEV